MKMLKSGLTRRNLKTVFRSSAFVALITCYITLPLSVSADSEEARKLRKWEEELHKISNKKEQVKLERAKQSFRKNRLDSLILHKLERSQKAVHRAQHELGDLEGIIVKKRALEELLARPEDSSWEEGSLIVKKKEGTESSDTDNEESKAGQNKDNSGEDKEGGKEEVVDEKRPKADKFYKLVNDSLRPERDEFYVKTIYNRAGKAKVKISKSNNQRSGTMFTAAVEYGEGDYLSKDLKIVKIHAGFAKYLDIVNVETEQKYQLRLSQGKAKSKLVPIK